MKMGWKQGGVLLGSIALITAFQNCSGLSQNGFQVTQGSSTSTNNGDSSGNGEAPPSSTPPPPVVLGPPLPMPPQPAAGNSMIVADRSGQGLTNYPLQFGRPFKVAEIANFPQVLIDGVAVPTQADIKTRFPDGSVKHAILSVVIPNIPAGGSVSLTFRNQNMGNNAGLTAAQMLAGNFNFDAVMKISNGSQTLSASARQMLQNGDYTTWTSGPIATTVILGDHSVQRKYDMGFDSYKSIRPLFHATFWPGLNLVRVRSVAENINTKTLEDVAYSVTLTSGSGTPQVVYSNNAVNHYFGTRWTKQFWLNGAPDIRVNVNHNIAYLAQTQSFPNYDPAILPQLDENLLANNYARWNAAPRNIYDSGFWTKYMPTTGGRADIGIVPTWTALWFYTGDWRAKEVAFGHADLASAWPLHWREGDDSLRFDRAQTISALGKPISVAARPALWLPDNNGDYAIALSTPRIKVDGYPGIFGNWVAESAHSPDPFTAQYVLSGDFYYLEELQFWAAGEAINATPGGYGRGLPGYLGVQDQIRGNAWILRTRMNAAFFSPDGTPEKNYFLMGVNDALAMWEGAHGVMGTSLQSHPNWVWASQNLKPAVLPPLHFWYYPGTSVASDDSSINTATVGTSESLWMDYYLMAILGIAKERGFSAGGIFSWHATLLNGQFAEPSFDPHLGSAYHTPVAKKDGSYFSSWTEIQQVGYTPAQISEVIATFGQANYYPTLASSAAAYTANEPGGAAAWGWLNTNARPKANYRGEDLSWNVIPRSSAVAPLPGP